MLRTVKNMTKAFISNESGQSMIEYAVLAALLIIAIILIIKGLGSTVGNKFQNISDELNKTNP